MGAGRYPLVAHSRHSQHGPHPTIGPFGHPRHSPRGTHPTTGPLDTLVIARPRRSDSGRSNPVLQLPTRNHPTIRPTSPPRKRGPSAKISLTTAKPRYRETPRSRTHPTTSPLDLSSLRGRILLTPAAPESRPRADSPSPMSVRGGSNLALQLPTPALLVSLHTRYTVRRVARGMRSTTEFHKRRPRPAAHRNLDLTPKPAR